jgi:S-adenosylmethionine hydrolase
VTEASIIHIDRFGNCITNLTREDFDEGGLSAAELSVNGRDVSSQREFFADGGANKPELFCVFGSAGYLEIAAQSHSAATILGVQPGQPVILVSRRVV